MASKRKRFCRQCESRVSRSASRCWYCGKLLFDPKRLGLAASALVGLVLLLGRIFNLF